MTNRKNNTAIRTKKSTIEGKVFELRESPLTQLSHSAHFATIKNVFYATLLGFIVRDVIYSFVLNQKVTYGLDAIQHGFVKLPTMLMIWCILFGLNLLTYFSFKLWSNLRMQFSTIHCTSLNWRVLALDCTFFVTFFLYFIGTLCLLPFVIRSVTFGMAAASALCMEQIRLLMKSYAFIRVNVASLLNHKEHSDQILFRPTFEHYLYFSFAPTLIYRHEYPRTTTINWLFVIKCFFDFFASIWIASYIFETFFLYRIHNIDISKNFWNQVLQIIMDSALPGLIQLAMLSFIFLHCWLNAFAEMLRFGDRQFYTDWWTITNFTAYFRKWNVIIGDWLHEYVYKDFRENITPNSKSISRIMVFLISAVFHEYIMTVITQHFFPLMFVILFLTGIALPYLNFKHSIINIIFLYCTGIACGTLLIFYTVEFVVNRKCSITETGVMNYLVPKIFRNECVNYV
ncbi:sterol O-acyltransferase 1-like [Onthophagus taurus]|uniref:sterol O-acyltransferase 1-like n=1 Tax=Onthophagus taurus TaxID=166361 RepID=UPI0039BE726A